MSTSKNDLVELQETLYTSKNPTRMWLHVSRREWIYEAMRSCAAERPVDRSIEVGPGAGGYLPLLCELSTEVVAADIEAQYLEYAQEQTESMGNLKCITDDITNSALPAGEFELVLCTEVIEHIADSSAALAGLKKMLAPDGRLILSTPQRYSPLEIFAKIAFLPGIIDVVRWIYREPIIPTGHINLLTEGELKRQLDAAGLEILKEFKLGLYLPIIAEAMGKTGLRLEQTLERAIRGTRLDWLLWTQCYVLKARQLND
ncbi:MAG: class I SAM-dependent methyltransferase [Halioglobus sp.]|nr:class I SAM-dependent methyltransferase [Halioglobus sp.]